MRRQIARAKPKTTTRAKAERTKTASARRSGGGKLDAILAQQERILKNEERIQKEERKIERLEERTLTEEEAEDRKQSAAVDELQKLEQLEKEVKWQVEPHPLSRVTYKDFFKGIIGAFIGIVVHFTFIYGVEIAEHVSSARASFLLLFTFLIGSGFLYGTGFRKIEDKSIMWLLPYRMIVLYSTAVIVTTVTLFFFYPHFFSDIDLAYRQIAVVNLSAVIGACTADLIGRE